MECELTGLSRYKQAYKHTRLRASRNALLTRLAAYQFAALDQGNDVGSVFCQFSASFLEEAVWLLVVARLAGLSD